MTRVILASSSPRRKEFMNYLGLQYECIKPDVDETVKEGELPENLVLRLSKDKAFAVSADNTDAVVIAADTAISAKECNDYSCFLVGGITQQNKLHILEMVHGKWEYPELKQQAIELFNRWQFDKRHTSASNLYIENRASGQQMIQDFKKAGLPVTAIDVTKDKLSRVQEILTYIANGNVLLPESEIYANNPVLLAECEEFTRDMAHSHDDIVDTLCHLINSTIAKRQISILDVL